MNLKIMSFNVNGIRSRLNQLESVLKKLGLTPILIHGGGWISGSKENQRIMAQHLAENGFVAITASYRLSREAPYPAGVIDLKDALRWMKLNSEKYHVDTQKIAVLGTSAGAQLATLVGVTPNSEIYNEKDEKISSEVQAIVNIDGITSFIHPDAEESEIAGLWLGGLRNENPKNWKIPQNYEHFSWSTLPTPQKVDFLKFLMSL